VRTVQLKGYALALPVFALGILASLKTGDWSWFARSGSAVVAIGVVLTSHEILDHNRRLRESRARWEQRLQPGQCHHDWGSDEGMRALLRSRNREDDIWTAKFHGFRMLVGGTLVWGFGDLVGLLLAI